MVAATLTARKSPLASAGSLVAGAALLVVVMTEVIITQARSPLQPLLFAVGAAIVLLSAPPRSGGAS